MLLAVRHARTSFNEDGHEKLRGWLPIPLSPEGIQESHQTAQFLARLKLPIQSFQTSPLKRALQTAAIVGQALGHPPQPTDALKDWNVGVLAGKSVMDTLPIVHKYLTHPDIVPPQGEAYQTFRQRVEPLLVQLIADAGTHLVVSHNRVMTLLSAIAHQNDKLLLQRGPVEPGGVVVVKPDRSLHVLFKGREGAAQKQGQDQAAERV